MWVRRHSYLIPERKLSLTLKGKIETENGRQYKPLYNDRVN